MSRPPNNGVKHAPSWAPASALWGLMLAGCAGGCAGSSPPKNSPSRVSEALAGEVPPDPAYARGPWRAPVPAPQAAGKLAWAGTSAPATCRAVVDTGPVSRVANEADFEALFCRSSDVDWQRLQLYVYRLAPTARRTLLTEDVVLQDSEINWLLVPEPCPDWSGPSAQPAILIARSDLPVVARPKPAVPVDCPATGDGYGY